MTLVAAAGATGAEPAWITNDAVTLGILMAILAFVFVTELSKHPFWVGLYRYVPGLLLCYFLPGLLGTAGVISGEDSKLYFVASRYLLPTSLVLLTLSLDLPAIRRLGPKMIIMFLTGTAGVVIGGPLVLYAFAKLAPSWVAGTGPEAVWRGMSTVAGSWIGGGANQAAMKEVFLVGDEVFSQWIAVDVIVANVWMAFLLFGAGRAERIDARTGADASAIVSLREKVEKYRAAHARIASTTDLFKILAVGFVATALGHVGADVLGPYFKKLFPVAESGGGMSWIGAITSSLSSGFFWLIVISTALGVAFSMTRARKLEGAGASRVGTVMLYVLVATIGMKMNLLAILDRPQIFVVGLAWIALHGALLLTVGRLIKAPFFFVAVGSQANIGGAASAPVVAAAFHPALAPVGVLMAVLGYAIGTYAAWACGLMMQAAGPM